MVTVHVVVGIAALTLLAGHPVFVLAPGPVTTMRATSVGVSAVSLAVISQPSP